MFCLLMKNIKRMTSPKSLNICVFSKFLTKIYISKYLHHILYIALNISLCIYLLLNIWPFMAEQCFMLDSTIIYSIILSICVALSCKCLFIKPYFLKNIWNGWYHCPSSSQQVTMMRFACFCSFFQTPITTCYHMKVHTSFYILNLLPFNII